MLPLNTKLFNLLCSKSRLRAVYLVPFFLATFVLGGFVFALGAEQSTDKTIEQSSEPRWSSHEKLIYTLLLGEMAANRQMPSVALPALLKAAKDSQDPVLAKEVTQWAIQYQDAEKATESAILWANMDKNSLQAQMVAATLLIGQSIDKALPYLARSLEIDPNDIDQHILSIQVRLSEYSSMQLNKAIVRLAKERKNDPYASLTAATSSAALGDVSNANYWVDSALNLSPDLTRAVELKARLIRYQSNSDETALTYLANHVAKYAKNKELKLFYASALIDANKIEAAIHQLKGLSDDKTFGGQASLFLGEIYLRTGKLKESQKSLEKSLTYEDTRNTAEYLLGELSEKRKDIEEAIRWYSEVNSGPMYITAQIKAAKLLKNKGEYKDAIRTVREAMASTEDEQKQLLLTEIDLLADSGNMEDAMNLSSEILSKLPQDMDILLSHAGVAMKMKQWKLAENDLRNIIKLDPRQANALNALGLVLSYQPGHIDEAIASVKEALKLSPNNPLFLDNLGWLYFRKGSLDDAVLTLKEALEYSQDPSIIAHLGEVLWAKGQKEESTALLSRALKKDPDNTTLLDTMSRLK